MPGCEHEVLSDLRCACIGTYVQVLKSDVLRTQNELKICSYFGAADQADSQTKNDDSQPRESRVGLLVLKDV